MFDARESIAVPPIKKILICHWVPSKLSPKEYRCLTCKLPNYCDCYLTGTRSAWSWSWLVIAASHLPPVTRNGTGYITSRMASHSNLSWHPFFSTSALLICQPPSSECMHIWMIQ